MKDETPTYDQLKQNLETMTKLAKRNLDRAANLEHVIAILQEVGAVTEEQVNAAEKFVDTVKGV